MSKTIIALSLMLASLGASAATNKAVRITSKVENGLSVTRVFNGSLFTTVCRGEVRVVTADEQVLVKEITKLVVRSDEVQVLRLQADQEIVASEAILNCQV